MRRIILIQLLFLLLAGSTYLSAQVGINTEEPNPLSELDIQNLLDGTDTIPRGIIVPRLTEKLRDQIDVNDKTVANGLFIYNIDEDCYNYYSREDSEWKSVCGKLGNAKFDPVDCSDIVVKGIYTEGINTDASNYLSIKLNVTKPGSYIINGTTGNGYFFTISGTALETGPLTINVPAQGKPTAAGTDHVTIVGLPLVNINCSPEIIVAAPTATYSINCSSIVVYGQYLKGTELTSTNTIKLNINVSVPGTYSINTPLTNGISFEATGSFATAGTQQVTLLGTGNPTVNNDFPITINTNTPQGNNTCTTIIPITLPSMTYAIIGTGVWSWAAAPRIDALTNGGQSFGPNGTIKIKSFTQLWQTTTVNTATNNLNNGFNGKQPDVVLYFAYGAAPTANLTQALINYINKGGCVIYGSADGTSAAVNILLNGIFGESNAQAQIAGTGTVDDNTYPIANLSNDPIINGPFGNLSGRYWGEDNASTGSVIVTQLPANSVQIASANNSFGKTTVDPEYSIVWYNESKNFVYFGDSVGASSSSTSWLEYPTIYTSTGFPKSKYYGNYPLSSQSQYVYNAALEMNAVAWAVKKAAISGINPY